MSVLFIHSVGCLPRYVLFPSLLLFYRCKTDLTIKGWSVCTHMELNAVQYEMYVRPPFMTLYTYFCLSQLVGISEVGVRGNSIKSIEKKHFKTIDESQCSHSSGRQVRVVQPAGPRNLEYLKVSFFLKKSDKYLRIPLISFFGNLQIIYLRSCTHFFFASGRILFRKTHRITVYSFFERIDCIGHEKHATSVVVNFKGAMSQAPVHERLV